MISPGTRLRVVYWKFGILKSIAKYQSIPRNAMSLIVRVYVTLLLIFSIHAACVCTYAIVWRKGIPTKANMVILDARVCMLYHFNQQFSYQSLKLSH